MGNYNYSGRKWHRAGCEESTKEGASATVPKNPRPQPCARACLFTGATFTRSR